MSFRMPPAGRSDESSCESKQKYRHCFLKLEQGHAQLQDPLQHCHLLEVKNLVLLKAAIDIFDLRRKWDVLRRKIR